MILFRPFQKPLCKKSTWQETFRNFVLFFKKIDSLYNHDNTHGADLATEFIGIQEVDDPKIIAMATDNDLNVKSVCKMMAKFSFSQHSRSMLL